MLTISKDSPREIAITLGEGCGALCHWSGHCCKNCSGILVEDEKKRIAQSMKLSEDEFESRFLENSERFHTPIKQFKQTRERGRPHGKCIMLGKDNRCAIYKNRPLFCRVGNCRNIHGGGLQDWFALNFFVDPNDAESVRQWAHRLKAGPTIAGGELHELVPDQGRLRAIMTHEALY